MCEKEIYKMLKNYIKEYMQYRQTVCSQKTYVEDKHFYDLALQYFGDVDFKNVKTGTIEKILFHISKDKSVDKSVRLKNKMKLLMSYVIRYDLDDIKYNVFKEVERLIVPHSEKKEKNYFEMYNDVPSEHHTITRLMRHAKTRQDKLLLLMCTITGGRINEIQRLKWSDVHTEDTNPYLTMHNTVKSTSSRNMETTRKNDISEQHVKILQGHKDYAEQMRQTVDPYDNGTDDVNINKANKNPIHRWTWVLSDKDGYKPSYNTIWKRYRNLWTECAEIYKDHEYPWLHTAEPSGFTFHCFRRHYINSVRESFGEDYTQADHENLQLMIGHKPGSKITNDEYVNWTRTKVVERKMNSKINLGVTIE